MPKNPDLKNQLAEEQRLLPLLETLGAPEGELMLLRGEQALLKLLAEESRHERGAASAQELERVLRWHDRRIARLGARMIREHPPA